MIVLAGDQNLIAIAGVLLLALATAALARRALRSDARSLRELPPPGVRMRAAARPVLLCNPRSGGGKASTAFVEEARRRGIETVMLEPGSDLAALARNAIRSGADALGMAGGDGSQSVVAAIAAEHDLPFVCIPAGTRNHFALDLGVDRDDLVGALDAFADGAYERPVDLARVNGRVFVNNVSFGIYAEIVQSDDYRDNKVGTAAAMLPELLGPDYAPFDLELDGPAGAGTSRPDLILVSNNVYRLSGIGGLGTRVRLDAGLLGVIVVDVHSAAELAQLVTLEAAGAGSRFTGWHEWSAPDLEVRSGGPVNAGIDGEAVALEPPVRFVMMPGALRVRIAPHHPGMSPAAVVSRVRRNGARRLVRLAAGLDREHPSATTAG
jgi:diacylglycerol kinase family enzyme